MTLTVATLWVLAAANAAELRLAVVVGSNSAVSGRAELRYAHSDARSIADVLRATGRFAAGDVTTLLDASPQDVLAAVDAAAARAASASQPALFLFYYSGHADDRALYPGGKPLALAELKAHLEVPAFGVRVGIIDSCRGGAWTQAKGLTPIAPFEVRPPPLASEGTALLAASSGLEEAHETESLQGSFFTHHLVAGLRGAADQSGDGLVTLSEAFAYANRLTIRDTAVRTPQPQHPSFDVRLHGRQDLVLSEVGGSTTLTVDQHQGPLQLVQLSTGVVVVEATPGQQVLRVALPPGEYLVRRVTEGGVLSRPVTVLADKVTTVDEASLTLVGEPALAPKSAAPPLAGDHALAISAMVMPGNFGTGLGGQLAYRWRFLRSLGLRLRGALGTPLSNGLSEQMMRDFAVFPTAFKVNTLAIGTDLEWLPQPEPLGAGGLTVGLAVGVGVLGSSTLDFSSVTFAPAGTGSLRLGVHLPWLPNLETQAEISVHVGVVSGSPVFQGQLTAGFAWHFHHR